MSRTPGRDGVSELLARLHAVLAQARNRLASDSREWLEAWLIAEPAMPSPDAPGSPDSFCGSAWSMVLVRYFCLVSFQWTKQCICVGWLQGRPGL
jgi:hypothetical protein